VIEGEEEVGVEIEVAERRDVYTRISIAKSPNRLLNIEDSQVKN